MGLCVCDQITSPTCPVLRALALIAGLGRTARSVVQTGRRVTRVDPLGTPLTGGIDESGRAFAGKGGDRVDGAEQERVGREPLWRRTGVVADVIFVRFFHRKVSTATNSCIVHSRNTARARRSRRRTGRCDPVRPVVRCAADSR